MNRYTVCEQQNNNLSWTESYDYCSYSVCSKIK